MSIIVGVSGPPGAGKSALARALLAELGDAQAIYMDHYERMTREPLDTVARWAERGADFDELPAASKLRLKHRSCRAQVLQRVLFFLRAVVIVACGCAGDDAI